MRHLNFKNLIIFQGPVVGKWTLTDQDGDLALCFLIDIVITWWYTDTIDRLPESQWLVLKYCELFLAKREKKSLRFVFRRSSVLKATNFVNKTYFHACFFTVRPELVFDARVEWFWSMEHSYFWVNEGGGTFDATTISPNSILSGKHRKGFAQTILHGKCLWKVQSVYEKTETF